MSVMDSSHAGQNDQHVFNDRQFQPLNWWLDYPRMVINMDEVKLGAC